MLDEALARLRQTQVLIGSSLWCSTSAATPHWLQRDLPRAAGCFTESITVAQTIQQTRAILGAVHGLAGVALALGQAERAARLLGAVEAAREALGMGRITQKHHGERITADTRAALEAADFAEAWSAGRVLTLEEAVARGARDRGRGRDRGEGLTSPKGVSGARVNPLWNRAIERTSDNSQEMIERKRFTDERGAHSHPVRMARAH